MRTRYGSTRILHQNNRTRWASCIVVKVVVNHGRRNDKSSMRHFVISRLVSFLSGLSCALVMTRHRAIWRLSIETHFWISTMVKNKNLFIKERLYLVGRHTRDHVRDHSRCGLREQLCVHVAGCQDDLKEHGFLNIEERLVPFIHLVLLQC